MELVDGAADETPLPFRPVPMLDDGVEEPSATNKKAGEMRRQLVQTDPEGRRAHAARIAKGGGTLCLSHGPWLRLGLEHFFSCARSLCVLVKGRVPLQRG